MLKIKREVNYRQAKISVDGRYRNCGHCANRQLIDIHSCAAFYPGKPEVLRQDYRCAVIGLENSNRYSVAANHICDRVIPIIPASEVHVEADYIKNTEEGGGGVKGPTILYRAPAITNVGELQMALKAVGDAIDVETPITNGGAGFVGLRIVEWTDKGVEIEIIP